MTSSALRAIGRLMTASPSIATQYRAAITKTVRRPQPASRHSRPIGQVPMISRP